MEGSPLDASWWPLAEHSGLSDFTVLETEEVLFRVINTREYANGRLIVDALCEPLDPDGQQVETVVKAATYHDVLVEDQGDGWRAVVYLDL